MVAEAGSILIDDDDGAVVARDPEGGSGDVAPPQRVPAARGASMYGVRVEYALHTMAWLMTPLDRPASSRDLADFQGLPTALMAKLLPNLEKAGLLTSSGGIGGGYRLARPPEEITILDIVDAVEGDRRLFDCKEVRRGCVLFGGVPPSWSAGGVCGIHAVMIRAERAMRRELARTNLADIARSLHPPAGFAEQVERWFAARMSRREEARVSALRTGRQSLPTRDNQG